MAMKQVTLRSKVVINLGPNDPPEKFGLEPGSGNVITLPAGLVNIPEALADHWYVKAHIAAARQPIMGGANIEHRPITPAQAAETPDEAETTTEPAVILPADDLEKLDDDALREYLRGVGNVVVAKDAPRDKVLARIEKLRPKTEA